MAKKKNIFALQKADLEDSRWINTPWAYTRAGANLSLLQQEILIKVSDHLQGYIKDFFAEDHAEDSVSPRSLFTDYMIQNGIPPIRVYFTELNVLAEHYDKISDAVENIRTVGIWRPYIDERTGKKFTSIYNVFSSVKIPTKEGGFKYIDKGTGEEKVSDRRAGYIDLYINKDVAAYAFDMSQGYVKHIKKIAAHSSIRSTPRLYLYLMRYANQGIMKVKVPTFELREYTGQVVRDQNTGEVISIKNPKFARFRERVLDAAMHDMERMGDENKSDIVFDYKPIYKNGKSRGEPEFIEFTIKRTQLGEARDAITHRAAAENKLIKSLCSRCPDLHKDLLKDVLRRVPSLAFFDFLQYAYKEVWAQVERRQPDDVAAYVLALLSSWAVKKNKEETKAKNKPVVQPDLFANQPEPQKPVLQPGMNADLWQQLVVRYNGPLKSLVARIEYLGMYNGMFSVQLSEEDNKMLENDQKEADEIKNIAKELLGRKGRYIPAIVFDIKNN